MIQPGVAIKPVHIQFLAITIIAPPMLYPTMPILSRPQGSLARAIIVMTWGVGISSPLTAKLTLALARPKSNGYAQIWLPIQLPVPWLTGTNHAFPQGRYMEIIATWAPS